MKIMCITHNTADQEQEASFFVKPDIVGHIIAVVHAKPLIGGIVVQVDKFLLEFLKGNTDVFLLSSVGVI